MNYLELSLNWDDRSFVSWCYICYNVIFLDLTFKVHVFKKDVQFWFLESTKKLLQAIQNLSQLKEFGFAR